MIKLLSIALLLALTGTAHATPDHDAPATTDTSWSGEWTKTDTAFEVATVGLLLLDWNQTVRITRDGMESNVIMGERGEKVSPNLYFPIVIGVQMFAARVLPQPWRRISQCAVIGVQANSTHANWVGGYKVSF